MSEVKMPYYSTMVAMVEFYANFVGPRKPLPYTPSEIEARNVMGVDSKGNIVEWVEWQTKQSIVDAARAADRWGYHGF